MEIVKKNLISIICGVIAILAVVAIFWPITPMYDKLRVKLAQRIGVGASTDQVASSPRHLPLLSPDQTDPGTLNVFPNNDVIKAGTDAITAIGTQAANMVQKAVDANQHTPLYPNALPKPDDVTRYNFANAYIKETTGYARWQKILNSTPIPDKDDIAQATQAKEDQIYSRLGVPETGGGDPGTQEQAKEEFASASEAISSDLENQRALDFAIYLQPGALPYDQTITVAAGHLPPAADEIWDAQLQMWIVDDIAHAIRNINDAYADSADPNGAPVHDILHEPVKQLEKLDGIMPIFSTDPTDVTKGNGSATPLNVTLSPTGRVSNAFYDVIHFHLVLLVDAAKIPQVLHGLQTGQFITIWNAQIDDVIDPAIMAQAGYRLGDKPVVRLEIDGEDLMLQSWTADLKPDDRKAGIGPGGASTPGAARTPQDSDTAN
jgi:hypothetical protein